ncbi:hypothetical protein FDR10_22365 [Salmonella enterica]|nr:hypothetical protein [Salmonella enterica]EBT7486543.1 hypothetical protein [Salmonella enterica]ECJ2547522.1 hypothetical protein [Salmonella enterica subsp. arizonae]
MIQLTELEKKIQDNKGDYIISLLEDEVSFCKEKLYTPLSLSEYTNYNVTLRMLKSTMDVINILMKRYKRT